MSVYEILQVFVQILAVGIIPACYLVFRDLQELKLRSVEMRGELQNNKDRIDHIHANYKMGIEHLNERMERLETDLSNMGQDIKEIMKFIYAHGKPVE